MVNSMHVAVLVLCAAFYVTIVNAIDCEPVKCRIACSNGYAVDKDGCPTCQCNPEPAPSECSPIMCMMECPGGEFAKDANNCPICQCPTQTTAAACSPIMCTMQCPDGEFAKDENGCPVCRCP